MYESDDEQSKIEFNYDEFENDDSMSRCTYVRYVV